MLITDELKAEELIEKIKSDELHMALVKKGPKKGFVQALCECASGSGNVIFQNGDDVIEIYSVLYSEPQVNGRSISRGVAVNKAFTRWNDVGHNTRNAKDPFKSKAFLEYIRNAGWDNETLDYVVFGYIDGKFL